MSVALALRSALPEMSVSDALEDLECYSRDMWPRRLIELRAGRLGVPPAAVAFPERLEQVAALVEFARKEGAALVPFGAGSGVAGGVSPDRRSVVVDLKRFRGVSVDRDAQSVSAGAGVMGIDLEEELARNGLTLGHFPSSILCSTVGGWLAARSAGQCSGRYGKIENMVLSSDAVLGSGDLVRFRSRVDALNLLPLMIGSEGTLGIITEATLRLYDAPEAREFAAYSFDSIESGWEALRELFQAGLRPSVARLYDPIDSALMAKGSVRGAEPVATPKRDTARSAALGRLLRRALFVPKALNDAVRGLEETPFGRATLIFVLEGKAEEVKDDRLAIKLVCTASGARELGAGPARAWYQHRYAVSYRQSPMFRLGAFTDTMEVAAPWSRLPVVYREVRSALAQHVLVLAHLSHAYPDGCSIYFTFVGAEPDDERALSLYDRTWQDALVAAISAGATLSHHHGVGRSKAPKLGAELGVGVDVIRQIMRAWDPDRILNPGNLAPREGPETRQLGATGEDRDQIDEPSLIANFDGARSLCALEEELGKRGLTLGLSPGYDPNLTLSDWVSRGLRHAPDPWSDPVDHTLAGFDARLGDGRMLQVHAAPRRAVGPDLSALFAGAHDRIGRVTRVSVRVFRRGRVGPRTPLAFSGDRRPAVSDSERDAWERIVAVMSSLR